MVQCIIICCVVVPEWWNSDTYPGVSEADYCWWSIELTWTGDGKVARILLTAGTQDFGARTKHTWSMNERHLRLIIFSRRFSIPVSLISATTRSLLSPSWTSKLNNRLFDFLGALAKLRITAISFVMSVCLSVRVEKLGSHLTDFHEILYFRIFRISFGKYKFR